MSKKEIPEEFEKVIKDFVRDIKNTFPEYSVFIQKWWKEEENLDAAREKAQIQFLFKYCMKKFPPRFFDILYQNNDIFLEDSEVDTEFLPQIHFKNLWECEITDKTRDTIWKYLQLIMFSIVNCVENKEAFGDSTAEMFESMDSEEFRSKLEDTMNDIQKIFETASSSSSSSEDGESNPNPNPNPSPNPNVPNAEDIYGHVTGMLGGKLGQLAKEIAEETAESFNMDMENVTDVKDVMSNLMKNPSKMMGLVKNVGNKLDSKIKSGEIKESELISEASEMIKKMKDIPGMGNIQDILSKMGIGGRNSKVNLNAMQEQLDRNMKAAQMRERMRNNVNAKKQQTQSQAPVPVPVPAPVPAPVPMSDENLIKMMGDNTKKGTNDKKKKAKKGKKV
jgi:hypothetical protein